MTAAALLILIKPCPPCMGNPVSMRMALLAPRGPLIRTSWLLLWAKAKLIAPSPKVMHRLGEQKRQKSRTQTFAKGHLRNAEEGRRGCTSTVHFRRTLTHHTILLDSVLRGTNVMTSITCPWFHPEGAPGQLSRMDSVTVKSTENLS